VCVCLSVCVSMCVCVRVHGAHVFVLGETWSLTSWEEHRPRIFQNRVLRAIFGTKRDDIAGSWRKMHMRTFKICTPE
jgi:hypothetical protein